MTGLWLPDGAPYLADLRHPVIHREYTEHMTASGRRYNEPMSPRERRQFDREMVAKYGAQCPPPPRAFFSLMSYDAQDAQEEAAARAARVPVMVTVCEEEDLFSMEEVG